MSRRQQARVAVTVVGGGSFVLAVLTVVVLLLASAHAPPPAEPRTVDYGDDPARVAADAVYNLRAAEYTYHVRVTDTGDQRRPDDGTGTGFQIRGDEPTTTVEKHVRIDNPARRYRGRVTFPYIVEGDPKWVTSYAEGPVGHSIAPPSLGDGQRHEGLAYAPFRNAFDRGRLATASATVVTENQTTYVVRVTDDEAAMETAYPGTPALMGTRRPPLENGTANLTLTLDRATGHPVSAVLWYHDHRTGRTVVTSFTFEDYGRTTVSRPLGAGLPDQRVMLYRLDLGLWALATTDWTRALGVVAALVLAGVLLDRALGGDRW
jgi:hypothetical protein